MSSKRLVSLRLQRKIAPDDVVERYINYRGDRIDFTEEQYNQFLSQIPSNWNSDKDKLIYFAYFDNGEYLCQRNKEVYNFSIKTTEEKLYNYDYATQDECNQFVNFIEKYYTDIKLSDYNNLYEVIVAKLKDQSAIKYKLLSMRAESLSETDYMFNSDYVFKDETTRQDWIRYRQEWRDITEQQGWIDNNIVDISIPVSPKPRDQILDVYQQLGRDLQTADIPENLIESVVNVSKEKYGEGLLDSTIKSFCSTTLKVEVLKAFSAMKLPLSYSVTDVEGIESSLSGMNNYDNLEESSSSKFGMYLSDVDAKIQEINALLSEYEFGFTLSDVLSSYAESLKKQLEEDELQQQANALLNEMTMEEME